MHRSLQRDCAAAAEAQASQHVFDARCVAEVQATESAAARAERLVMQEQEHAAAVEAEKQRRAAEPSDSVQHVVVGPHSRVRPPPLDEEDELARTILEMVTAAEDAEGDSSSRQRRLRQGEERAERARQRGRDEQVCRLLGVVAARARERARERANVQAAAQGAAAEAAELAEQRATEAAELARQRAAAAHKAAAEAVEQWGRSALAPQLRSGRVARRVAAHVMSLFGAEASVYAHS